MDGEMIWLTRQQLATLFGRDYKTISKHINNALKEELADEVVVAKFATFILYSKLLITIYIEITTYCQIDIFCPHTVI